MAQSVTSEDCGPLIQRVSIAVYAVAVFFVALRFITRGWLVRQFGLDDLLIGTALLFGAGEMAMLQVQTKHGNGGQADQDEMDDLNKMLMYKYINMLLYYLANGAVKLSILALYYRICSLQKGLPWFLRGTVVWTLAAIIAAFTLAFLFVEMFSCLPVSAIFDLENTTRKCISWVPFYLSQAVIDVFITLILVLYPLPLLGLLKIDKKQRYALVLIFSIGLLPLIASIIRLCQIVIAVRTTAEISSIKDVSWEGRWIPLWSQIEVDIGIAAASIPSLSPLLKEIWSGMVHSRRASQSRIPTLIEPDLENCRREAHGLQKLPSTISTLPNKSVSTLGSLANNSVSSLDKPVNVKRLTFFDDSEEAEIDCEAYALPDSTAQIGVARTINTRMSRAAFVDVPVSPRRSNGFTGLSMPDTAG